MTSARHLQIKEIFLEAVERSPGERPALVAERCAGDESLRQEVEKLLRHHDRAETRGLAPGRPGEADPWRQLKEECAANNDAGGATQEIPSRPMPEGGRIEPKEPESLATGATFAKRYRIVAELGAGGMGRVYRAEDLTIGETVALKLIHPRLASNPFWTTLFKNEARIARSITHANVCRIHDIGEADGAYYISMEYVDGEDLAGLLRRIGRLPREKAIEVARQVCFGLDAVHRAGAIHRDLKPANVMLDGRGVAKLTDFGLAALPPQLSGGDRPAGTPAYMAPEQITGRDVSPRSDIYALGLLMYEILSGQRAAVGSTIADFVGFHIQGRPTPLAEIVADLDSDIERVVMRCLQKEPEDRPRSVLEVAAALPGTDVLRVALEAGTTPSPSLVEAARPTFLTSKRLWLTFASAVLLFVVLAAVRTSGSYSWPAPGGDPPAVLGERARDILATADVAEASADCWSGFADAAAVAKTIGLIAGSRIDVADYLTPGRPYYWRACSSMRIPRYPAGVRFIEPSLTDLDRVAASYGERAVVALDPRMETVLLAADPPAGASNRDVHDFVRARLEALLPKLAGRGAGTMAIREVTGELTGTSGWLASVGDDGITLRADTLAADGRLTLLVARDGARIDPSLSQRDGGGTYRQETVMVWRRVLYVLASVAALPWALGVFRAGRTDRADVIRVGALAGATQLVALVLRVPSGATAEELTFALSASLLNAMGVGAVVGFCFAAVEPLTRRNWPDMMITWRRLLSGRFGDPGVRGHLLVGTTIGVAWALLATGERTLISALGWPARPMLFGERILEKGLGARFALAGYLEAVPEVLFVGVVLMLLLVLFRRLTGSPRFSAGLTVLVLLPLATPQAAHMATGWLIIGVGIVGAAVWVVVRFGVLATVSAFFVLLMLNQSLLTINTSSWYFGNTLVVFGMLLAGLLYACRTPGTARPIARE